MPRTLKLALAMGGGVSLGTFNGAAITEAVKLACLAGRDRNGQPYDRVEIDVLSGASAGALSLCLLLRDLAEPVAADLAKARAELTATLPNYGALPAALKDNLAQIQAAQLVQQDVWGDEAKLAAFLQFAESAEFDVGSLLNRGTQENIARKRIVPPAPAGSFTFAERRLLADRVLFAMSLTNLSPITADARKELADRNSPHAPAGLNDAMRSPSHRDLRVFDLNFTDLSQSPNYTNPDYHPWRWMFLHAGPPTQGQASANEPLVPWIGDLRTRASWQRLAATAIACGAFPLAFEPVTLERKAYEYGDEAKPEKLPDAFRANGGVLPAVNFAYVDGGVLNNEPLREAFRLAAFVDARTSGQDFDRWVLWVDPDVSAEADDSSVNVYRSWQINGDHTTLESRTTFEKLTGLIGTYLGLFLDEGRRQEADKVFQTRNTIVLRDALREMIRTRTAGASAPAAAEFKALVDACRAILDSDRANVAIPPGRLTPPGEVERLSREAGLGLDATDLSAVQAGDPAGATHPRETALALVLVLLDLALSAEGKREDHKLIAISPLLDDCPAAGQQRFFVLPGGKFSAFAGFMVRRAACADYEFDVAKFCARWLLAQEGCIDATALPPAAMPADRLDAARLKTFTADLAANFPKLIARLHGIVEHSQLSWLATRVVQSLIDEFEKPDALNRMTFARRTAEFRVVVDDEDFWLEDGTESNVGTVRDLGGKQTILFFADYIPEFREWVFSHREAEEAFTPMTPDAEVVVVRNGTPRLKLAFPSETELTALLRHPLAHFHATCASGTPVSTAWTIATDTPPALDLTL